MGKKTGISNTPKFIWHLQLHRKTTTKQKENLSFHPSRDEWLMRTLCGEVLSCFVQASIQCNRRRTSRSLCDNEMWCACLSIKSFSPGKAEVVLWIKTLEKKRWGVQCFYCVSSYPRCSMDDILVYILHLDNFLVYVGKYTIHWVFGYVFLLFFSRIATVETGVEVFAPDIESTWRLEHDTAPLCSEEKQGFICEAEENRNPMSWKSLCGLAWKKNRQWPPSIRILQTDFLGQKRML